MKMNRQTLILIGLALIALVGAIAYTLSRGPDKVSREEREMASEKEPGVRIGDDGIPVIDDDPKSVLERYKKWAQYPPHTRPLYSGMVDLLNPYNLERTPVKVIAKPAEGCQPQADGSMKCAKPPVMSDVECQMTPERYISVGKKDFHISLVCRDPRQNTPAAIESIEAKVYRVPLKETVPMLPPISIGDDGQNGDEKAGDKTYTITVRPAGSDWGPVYVEASFKVLGSQHVQRTDFYSTPHATAEFQKPIRDAQRSGHLVISVPVNVSKEGYYKFDANLLEKNGEQRPVASAVWEGDLTAGNHTINLEFFGKVIRDSGISGPYVVQNLRGMRNNSPVTPSMLKAAFVTGKVIGPQEHKEPLQEYMEPVAEAYVTGSYRPEDFSSDEWKSEDKDRRIQYLEELAKEQ